MARGVYNYRYRAPTPKTLAGKIAKQCRPLEKLYSQKMSSREAIAKLEALGLPTRGIGWLKVMGPGQISGEDIWVVKIEVWIGSMWGGRTEGARILIHKDRTYGVESTPGFPKELMQFFEMRGED